MENSFYIPINSGSLAHYFSRAIILPAKYFPNKPEDIQNTIGNAILVSKKKWVKNSDCTLEVVLTATEVKELLSVSPYFSLSNTPIPISRVKSICFLDPKQKETTIWNINSGAAFVPEYLVSVEVSKNIEFISADELNQGNQDNSVIDVSDKIKKYDIILGGFAFMRLGGKSGTNFSHNYFSTLSFFNKLIEEQTNNAANQKGLEFSNKYWGLFTKKESEWSNWQQYISKNITAEDVLDIAKTKNLKVEKNYLGILKLDNVDKTTHLYDFAVLATYGDGKSKNTNDLVIDLTNGVIHAEKAEDVSILFGLNNGYSKLRNRYKGSEKDSNVKFTLESKLDYYIIESIFQFVFHGSKPDYLFDYIDRWCPSKKMEPVKGFETYKILDTIVVVIAKKKQTTSESFLENYSADFYSTIVKSISQWLPPFAKIDEKEAIQYFEKQLRNTLTFSIEALQKKIENECEANYNSQKQDAVELHQKEIDKLRLEISNLKEENTKLKKDFNSSLVSEQLTEPLQKTDDTPKEYVQESSDMVSLVQEPPAIEVSDNYSSLSITDLKKIATQKGVSPSKLKRFKNENKAELIALIKQTPDVQKLL